MPIDYAEQRRSHPRAYVPWSDEEERELAALYADGRRDLRALASRFGRSCAAVRSRLIRLGLIE